MLKELNNLIIISASLKFAIRSQDMAAYKESYLLIVSGSLLVIIGILLAIRFYSNEKKTQIAAKENTLNTEINKISQKATGPKEAAAVFSYPLVDEPTLDVDPPISRARDYNTPTELLEKNLEETAYLKGNSTAVRNEHVAKEQKTDVLGI